MQVLPAALAVAYCVWWVPALTIGCYILFVRFSVVKVCSLIWTLQFLSDF